MLSALLRRLAEDKPPRQKPNFGSELGDPVYDASVYLALHRPVVHHGIVSALVVD